MASLVKGIHHITVCASGAQEDVDFMTKVVGQRLIKQTVLFDGRYAHYHLYYANANAEVGSVMTTFPYKRVPGRVGLGTDPGDGVLRAEGLALVLGGPPEASRGREQRRAGAVRREVHPLPPSVGAAARSGRERGRHAHRLDDEGDQRRRRQPRVLRAGAVGPRASASRSAS